MDAAAIYNHMVASGLLQELVDRFADRLADNLVDGLIDRLSDPETVLKLAMVAREVDAVLMEDVARE